MHAGSDLRSRPLDVCVLDERGERPATTVCPPGADGLRHLVTDVGPLGGPIVVAIGSINGAGFIDDTVALQDWDAAIADAQMVKGLAPFGLQDRQDRRVGISRARREGPGALGLAADPGIRAERERARRRRHPVRHRMLPKNRVHVTPAAVGKPAAVSDHVGSENRLLLGRLESALPDVEAGEETGTADLATGPRVLGLVLETHHGGQADRRTSDTECTAERVVGEVVGADPAASRRPVLTLTDSRAGDGALGRELHAACAGPRGRPPPRRCAR